jgi:hypothetical protein
MHRIAPTIRAGLTTLSLLLGASAIIGAATSGQAIASPLDPAPSPKTTPAARKCPVGSVCRAARECPAGRVCLWSADHFFGTKKVVRPVPSGKCRDITRQRSPFFTGWRSVYNASLEFARLWEFAIGPSTGNHLLHTRCEGSNNLVAPHTARRRLSFPEDATGLGGL